MTTEYMATHQSVKLSSGFFEFTRALEGSLGRLDLAALEKAGHDAAATEAAIETMQGAEGMTMFNVENLGGLLSLNGPHKRAKRYFIGNYMRAFQVVSADIRAGARYKTTKSDRPGRRAHLLELQYLKQQLWKRKY